MAKIVLPSRTFHDSSLLYGTDNLIMDGNVTESVALFGYELADDTFSFEGHIAALASSGSVSLFSNNDTALLYDGDGVYLRGKWYVSDAFARYPLTRAAYSCISAIGVLQNMEDHKGGIYTGQTVGTVVAEIFYGSGLTYTITPDVAADKLYGRLAKDNRRNNLALILIATGAALVFDEYGNAIIRYLTTETPSQVPKIYLKGNELQRATPYTHVAVTEHNFIALASDTVQTLFDNTAAVTPAANELVVFSNPCHDLTVTGTLTISESNANYAIVSGTGMLTGKEYTHTTRVLTLATGASGTQKTKTLEDVQLVTLTNSQYVAQRMAKFYGLVQRTKLELPLSAEIKPGKQISFIDKFNNTRTGWIEKLSYNLNPKKMKASATFLEGWTPGPFGSNITTYEILTGSGTWSPSGKNIAGDVTAVLIGGGQGGTGGHGGHGGDAGSGASNGVGGAGGAIGAGGSAGKVLAVTFTPSGSYNYACGAGGAGGAGGSGGYENIGSNVPGGEGAAGTAGAAGADTTFGTYSSASGAVASFTNPLTGDDYALQGLSGLYAGADAGNSVAGYSAGSTGQTHTRTYNYNTYGAAGGGGGGAAYGQNGYDGSDGDCYYRTGPPYRIISKGGAGGAGGTAAATSSAGQDNYGSGGRGGSGGGGGAGGGGFIAYNDDGTYGSGPGRGGQGGAGGAGSPGNDGVIILFYRVSE